MTPPDTVTVPNDMPAPPAEAPARQPTSRAATVSQHIPQLMPWAQLLVVVLGVLAIIWNQQQGNNDLRNEFNQAHSELRAELTGDIAELRAEIRELRAELTGDIAELRAEIRELRAEVAANGQRLARIEGYLGIGTPEADAR